MKAKIEDRKNILLVVAEDMGRHLGCYGNPDAKTPALDSFASSGVRFRNAWCSQPVCSAARAAILTGQPNHENGMLGLSTAKMRCFDGVPSLPSLLSQNGYRTALLGKHHVLPENQFTFDFRWKGDSFNFFSRDYASMLKAAGDFLESGDAPFFLMAALPDAHVPFLRQSFGEPKNPRAGSDVGVVPGMDQIIPEWADWYADYHNCIERADLAFAGLLQLLKNLGLDSSTLVIFTADHGFQFPRGKFSLYEQGLGVPLLLGGAGIKGHGLVIDTPVMGVDVFATVLEAAGVKLPANCRGTGLLELTAGEEIIRLAFGERTACSPYIYFPQRAVRGQRFKLIRSIFARQDDPHFEKLRLHDNSKQPNESQKVAPMPDLSALSLSMREACQTWSRPPEYQLYDLQEDPLETVNLAGRAELAGVEIELKNALEFWMQETRDFVLNPALLQKFTAEVAEYVSVKREQGTQPKDFTWKYPDYMPPALW